MFKMIWIFVVSILWFESFTPSERVALGSAFLVLIGVVGEYVVELEALEERERLRKRIKRLSMALLMLGLSGDVLGIVMSQAEMATLIQETGTAKSSAEAAEEMAGSANKVSGKALDKSKAAMDVADRAQKKIGAVARQADDLLAKYLDAENKLERLEPRGNLLARQACPFVLRVKAFPGQKVKIFSDFSRIRDPQDIEETRGFVSSVAGKLGQVSGWSISAAQEYMGWGITVLARHDSSSETRDAGNALASAFGECGLTDVQWNKPVLRIAEVGSSEEHWNARPDTLMLFIGERPHW